jgi:hypothetical protein
MSLHAQTRALPPLLMHTLSAASILTKSPGPLSSPMSPVESNTVTERVVVETDLEGGTSNCPHGAERAWKDCICRRYAKNNSVHVAKLGSE